MTLGADLREETRAFNEQLRQVLAAQPPLETVPPAVARRARYEGRSAFPPPVFLPQADWVDVPARSAALRARTGRTTSAERRAGVPPTRRRSSSPTPR